VSYSFERIGKLLEERGLRLAALQAGGGRVSFLRVEVAVESTPTGTRAPRYPFVARIKATDTISGMQLEGLTTDLSEGGCRISTRKGPFSEGTRILLEITKNGVSLLTIATVVYNLKDQFMGICFAEMPPDQAAILAGWIKAATGPVNPGLTAP
jgi:hypothetical protein